MYGSVESLGRLFETVNHVPLPSLIGWVWPSLRACTSNSFSSGFVADASGRTLGIATAQRQRNHTLPLLHSLG